MNLENLNSSICQDDENNVTITGYAEKLDEKLNEISLETSDTKGTTIIDVMKKKQKDNMSDMIADVIHNSNINTDLDLDPDSESNVEDI